MPESEEMPVILLSGVARVGKSRLANRLAAQAGFEVIHCDQFRLSFWSIADEQERSSERFRRYEEAVASRRAGLIIEGDDLVGRNRGDTSLAKRGLISNDPQLSPALLKHLQDRFAAKVFLLGFINANPDVLMASIRRHETDLCFTKALPDSGLRGYILTSINHSRQLRMMAAENHFRYLEIGEEDLDGAMEAAASQVLRELDRPGAELKL